jgi:hypothetical protein
VSARICGFFEANEMIENRKEGRPAEKTKKYRWYHVPHDHYIGVIQTVTLEAKYTGMPVFSEPGGY